MYYISKGLGKNRKWLAVLYAILAALATVFGDKFAALIVAIALALFAFSTVLGWSLCGTRCVQYLFGHRNARGHKAVRVFHSSASSPSLAWWPRRPGTISATRTICVDPDSTKRRP